MPSDRYDEDAKELTDTFDIDSSSGSDAETLVHSPTEKDRAVLQDHDEAEQLLTTKRAAREEVGRSRSPSWAAGKRIRRKRGKKRRKSQAGDEASGLMYEMEEGFKDTSSNSSMDSLLLQPLPSKRRLLSSPVLRWSVMSAIIALLFSILAYGAYRASRPAVATIYNARTLTNGTHMFKPTTILVSLDGFRADFLQRGLTPSMNAFIASGVSPKYMLPSFPSVTFPNHYTLVTGLYPESHGIVSNQFWDPELKEEFYYTKTAISMQPKWWEAAEPLWVTAEKQGIKTAIHMWPGSEAHIHNMDPTYLDKFNGFEKLPNKVDRVLELLDMDTSDRPQLIAAYVPDVDRDGHKYGPNSTEIRATIASADNMLTLLIEGLLQRNLTEIVNLVVVSDHGMATMSAHRMVQLDDLIEMNLVDHIDGWPLRGLRLKNPDRDVPIMHQQLLSAAKEHGTFDVYTRETMPDRYHFSNNPRIAPLWVVPKAGWLVIERSDFDIAKAIAANEEFHPIGIHGFDHEHPLMRAIFIARGPAFPHAPNSRVPVFQNIEVYNIVCDSLGITPHSNNGTTRLPMETEGLHSDFNEPVDVPKDDPADFEHDIVDSLSATSAESSTTTTTALTSPSTNSVNAEPVEKADAKSTWWKYIHEQLDKAKEWAKEIIESVKNNKNTQDGPSPG